MDVTQLRPAGFKAPGILLSGAVDNAMYGAFRQQLDAPDAAARSARALDAAAAEATLREADNDPE